MKLYYLPTGLCFLVFVDAVMCQDVRIRRLHIRSDIAFRFATTHIQSELINNGNTATEATFRVTLSKAAFMSNFSMCANGTTIYGEVKKKGIAKTEYEKAKAKGLSASHIASIRNTNDFRVSVNIAATQTVNFDLWYQEVLQRRLGIYEHVINIDPGQVVPDLKIEVHINESRPLTIVDVPDITKERKEVPGSKNTVITRCSNTSAEIVFTPTVDQQRSSSDAGIVGQFLVQYDVERDLDTGEVKMTKGYFVHVFAPDGLPPLPKNVLFLLDKSGSMLGQKEKQLKKAMFAILDDLRYHDMFNIITFSTSVDIWSNTLKKANKANIQKAKLHVTDMKPSGWTDINAALLRTVKFLNTNVLKTNKRSTIVIFLTDGRPTAGVQNEKTIVSNVQTTNQGEYTIFALGFGNDVNFDFLNELALQNGGSAQKIYDYRDAGQQIENFYDEISIPVLYNLSINYIKPEAKVLQVTRKHFKQFFQGGEILVAGRLSNSATTQIEVCMTGQMRQRNLHYCSSYRVQPWISKTGHSAFIERMWAYLTIQDLLEKALVERKPNIQSSIRQHALDLSLKYHFVTPLTSMIVLHNATTNPTDPKSEFSQWSSWTPCSAGKQVRFRTCSIGFCVGPLRNVRRCNRPTGGGWFAPIRRQTSTDCGFTSWSTWSPCSATCGTSTKARSRTRLGNVCTGSLKESRPCNVRPCPGVRLGPTSMRIWLETGLLCLKWRMMPLYAHILLSSKSSNETLELSAVHGEQGKLKTLLFTMPDGNRMASISKYDYIISATNIILGHNVHTWEDNYAGRRINIWGNEIFISLPHEVLVIVKRNGGSLLVNVDGRGNLSTHFTGLLSKTHQWVLGTNSLEIKESPARRFPVHRETAVGGETCKTVDGDIFDVAGYEPRAN